MQIMKTIVLAAVLNLAAANAISNPINIQRPIVRGQVLLVEAILYDGPIPSVHSDWLNSFYNAVPRLREVAIRHNGRKQVTCGNMTFVAVQTMQTIPNCTYSIIGVDLSEANDEYGPELLAFVNISLNGRTYARYLAAFRIKVQDFFGDLFATKELGHTDLARLAQVITKLSRTATIYEQKNHVDGEIIVSPRGPIKFDPLGVGFAKPSGGITTFKNSIGLYLSPNPAKRNIVGGNEIHSRAESAQLYASLSKTIALLWTSYETLQLNSDKFHRIEFKRHLVQNASMIASEFHDLFNALQNKRFQIIEIGHFFGQISDLIRSVNAILKDEVGSDPGFIEIINGSTNNA